TAPRALVVEENPVAAVYPVALSIVHGRPVRRYLRHAVGRARVKGGGLVLRRGRRAEHLARRGLVEASFDAGLANRLEQADGAKACGVECVIRAGEARPPAT